MNAKKAYRYILILFAVGIAGSVWLVQYASTWLTESSVELTTLRGEAEQLEQKRAYLETAKQTLHDKQEDIETLTKVIPTDKDQARIVKEIYQIAALSGIGIDSVGFPASTLGSAATPAPAAAVAATPAPSGSDATASTPTTTTATPAPTAPKAVSQATPVKDIPGVQSIDLTIGTLNSTTLPPATGVRYSEMIAFMKYIERNQRTIQIRSLGIGQGDIVDGVPTFTLDVALTIFIRA